MHTVGPVVIDPELAAFIQGPITMVFAFRDPLGWPTLGRAMGARPAPDGEAVDFFVGGGQWAYALEGVSVGSLVALTLADPRDYQAVQVKGVVAALSRATPEEKALASRYIDAAGAILQSVGTQPAQIAQWLDRTDPMTVVRFRLDAAFAQTPGPKAGQPRVPAP